MLLGEGGSGRRRTNTLLKGERQTQLVVSSWKQQDASEPPAGPDQRGHGQSTPPSPSPPPSSPGRWPRVTDGFPFALDGGSGSGSTSGSGLPGCGCGRGRGGLARPQLWRRWFSYPFLSVLGRRGRCPRGHHPTASDPPPSPPSPPPLWNTSPRTSKAEVPLQDAQGRGKPEGKV